MSTDDKEPVIIGEDFEQEACETSEGMRNGKPGGEAIEAKVAELAELTEPYYQACREDEAQELGVGLPVLDRMVKKARKDVGGHDSGQGTRVTVDNPEPWHESVNGAELLDSVIPPVGNAHVTQLVHGDAPGHIELTLADTKAPPLEERLAVPGELLHPVVQRI